MAKATKAKKNKLAFSNKLILNQWLLSLFGFDSLTTDTQKPFHKLSNLVKNSAEGLHTDNMHHFYYQLIQQLPANSQLKQHKLQRYEENIVKHTQKINDRREQAVVWKYYQWLTLLFIEIYLDFYFNNKEKLVDNLNTYLQRFNQHYSSYKNIIHKDIEPFKIEDLNKICLQNATGSGKTLLMHINYLQYLHYAKETNNNDLSRVILITPNAELSQQHIDEFNASGISTHLFFKNDMNNYDFNRIDAIEITRLDDKQNNKQGNRRIDTRSLGDNNLLLIDEGHRGLSSGKAKAKEKNAWFDLRSMLCKQGFSFEYSATFAQAVSDTVHEDYYAKTVIFDYSYKWFYEDGFGKDYSILNLSANETADKTNYLTVCLLKFYQQLDIYQTNKNQITKFNLEKPLWVFVGNTVNANKTKDEKELSSDVAKIIEFIAEFIADKTKYCAIIKKIIQGSGKTTGLLDKNGNDVFAKAFNWLAQKLNDNFSYEGLYQDILYKLFNATSSGQLVIDRIKGNSSEILLTVANADKAFGLINVGDTKTLADHLEKLAKQNNLKITIKHSDFSTGKFSEVKNSSSEINLLIGAKKFIEGWDCWRVSTFGLMHVGKSEGAQIIQLFGRGIRLKGYNWSLKRSSHVKVKAVARPDYLTELETLQVFGIEADFMAKFRDYLKEEGLPTDNSKTEFTIPIDVTYQFNKQLQIITPKRSAKNREFSFKQHGAVPYLTYKTMPKKIKQQPVIADWYTAVDVEQSQTTVNEVTKDQCKLNKSHIALLDINKLYFALEQYKRIKARYNLNIDKPGILSLLETTDWYILKIPKAKLQLQSFKDVNFLQRVAEDLLKRYCDKYYSYCETAFWENRLEYTELDSKNGNIPKEGASYTLSVESTDEQLKQAIKELQQQLASSNNPIIEAGDLQAYKGYLHLFQPLLHVDKNCNISISPNSLNASEFNFVTDLKTWYETNQQQLTTDKTEVLLLRNLAQGKGVEFFQAGNFAPDFILWVITATKQYITFVDPHGLFHTGIADEKINFKQTIKKIEHKLAATNKKIILNSFVVSPTEYANLNWEQSQQQLEKEYNILFMQCNKPNYINKLFTAIMQ